jgi:excisionase family DNA binding protein
VEGSKPDGEREDALTTNEVAALLCISPRTIRRWAAEGRLPAVVMPGGKYGFRSEEVRELARRLGLPPPAR